MDYNARKLPEMKGAGHQRETGMVLPDRLWGKSCSNPYSTTDGEAEDVCRQACENDDMCDFYTHYDQKDGVEDVCELSSECANPYQNKAGEMTYAKRRALAPTEEAEPAPPPKVKGVFASIQNKITRTHLIIIAICILLGAAAFWKMGSTKSDMMN